MTKISLVVFDRFTDLDLFMPFDLIGRAKTASRADWEVKVLATSDYVTSTAGMTIKAHGRIEETADSDVVIMGSGIGIDECLESPVFMNALRLDPRRQLIGSMCSGSMFLAKKGLLDGLEATTYPTYLDRLREFKRVTVVEKAFIDQGRIATAAGCLSAQRLSAWVIDHCYDLACRRRL
jgi:transcriptional regulator GlxA family with amidase domain